VLRQARDWVREGHHERLARRVHLSSGAVTLEPDAHGAVLAASQNKPDDAGAAASECAIARVG
jgi:hypothetical protein